MCGISGIVGRRPVAEALLESIRNLEYRGYDSCGVALVSKGGITVRKDVGTVEEVNRRMPLAEPEGTVGIAHTRWATHGEVTRANAHPHVSCSGDFALVHNGIIANYRHLREELVSEGHQFRSSTDTETIVHLVEKYYRAMGSVERAFVKALGRLEGSYAVALVSVHEPDRVYCARYESPLLIGTKPSATFLGSDFNAFLGFTRSAIALEDGEYAVLLPGEVVVKDLATRAPVDKTPFSIDWNVEAAKKGGYPHFMLKEIHEQPETVARALEVDGGAVAELARSIARHRRTYLVGVGTTYYVAQMAQYYFSSLARTFVPVISSDEFRSLAHVDADTLVIAISQSGETYDTLDAIRFARERGARTAAICNVMGSSLARVVDQAIVQGSGPEICVVSTKAALGQIVVLLRVAAAMGRLTGGEPDEAVARGLAALPDAIQQLIDERAGEIRELARKHSHIQNWLFLGRGIYHPVALESALKMKEVTYLHAEGMPAGFLKHGTLSLIDKNLFTVMLVPPKQEGALYMATVTNAEEVKARGGFIIGTVMEEQEVFDEQILLPKVPHFLAPILHLVALQLFAYHAAVVLDRNVDRPRALAKSVTVG